MKSLAPVVRTKPDDPEKWNKLADTFCEVMAIQP